MSWTQVERALGWRPRTRLTLPATQLRGGQSPHRSSPQRDATRWAAVHAALQGRAVTTSANFQHPKKKPHSHCSLPWVGAQPLEITEPFLSVDPSVPRASRKWGPTRRGPCVWLLLCMVFSGSAHAMPRVTCHCVDSARLFTRGCSIDAGLSPPFGCYRRRCCGHLCKDLRAAPSPFPQAHAWGGTASHVVTTDRFHSGSSVFHARILFYVDYLLSCHLGWPFPTASASQGRKRGFLSCPPHSFSVPCFTMVECWWEGGLSLVPCHGLGPHFLIRCQKF